MCLSGFGCVAWSHPVTVLGVQYFPAIHWKRRLALESPLKKALGKRFLMIRPPAVEIISHLRAFADDSRYIHTYTHIYVAHLAMAPLLMGSSAVLPRVDVSVTCQCDAWTYV